MGSIQVTEDEVTDDPIPLHLTDSILDAGGPQKVALAAPAAPVPAAAYVVLTIKRCTVFGIMNLHAVELGEDCIFTNCINVVRRQLGCLRFCSVPAGCRTPPRYHCQPDGVKQAAADELTAAAQALPASKRPSAAELAAAIAAAQARETERVRPQFNSTRYGRPDYAQLALLCADEIKTGAHDQSEMGAFHDLFQPQRQANLSARLNQYTPAGMDVGIIAVT